MKFKHRLAYYLFGLCLGGFLVAFIFTGRGQDFCYLPNCRVLKSIRTKGFTVSKEAQAKFNEKWVTSDDIKKTLEFGDIDFDKSNKQQKGGGKLYIIEGRNAKNEPITIEVINFENRAVLKDIKKQ
ncbi:MAG: DUF4258 domain-containing protein [Bacteroidota bacterium]